MQIQYQDNEILAIENGNIMGKIIYSLQDNTMSILHTYAYVQGKHIGSLLMAEALSIAAEKGYTIDPICSFAQAYMRKHIP